MAKAKQPHPFDLLLQLEQRSRDYGLGLPQQIDVKPFWTGIGFRLGDAQFVSPLGEVVEILHHPDFTMVPKTKGWVKGIANVRGNLLPIMDLSDFILEQPHKVGGGTRVLVVRHKGVLVGLVVEEVLGICHFLEDEQTSILPSVDQRIRPYLKRAYWHDRNYWGVFSMFKLVESPFFMQAAV